MPKKCIKFVPEYLIPSLDNKTFGERLKWIDKSKNIFEIDWSHKAGPHWSEREAQVFVEWDKHKGHFNPGNKQYYSQSKQRFRALLYKLTKEGHLKELPSNTKFKKVFCIGQKKNRRKKTDINAEYESCSEVETSSEEQEYGDPGAMICRKGSEYEAVNVLEDHPYSVSDNFPGFLIYNTENEQAILNSDIWVPTSSSESSLDNCPKKVLVERNCENITTLVPALMTSLFTVGYSPFEDLRDRPENSTLSLSAANQSISIPGSMFVDSSQPNVEPFESWLYRFYQNYEETK